MPNAVNRLKPKALVKGEKENENNVLRHRYRAASQKEKLAAAKTENVWERLSKVRKSISNEGSLGSGKHSRLTLQAKSSHRLNTVRPWIPKATRKPLVANTTANKRLTDLKKTTKKTKLVKTLINHEHQQVKEPDEPRSFIFLCKQESVRELLTARSMCNSKSSSDKSAPEQKTKLSETLRAPSGTTLLLQQPNNRYANQARDISISELESCCLMTDDSFDSFKIAPLMQVPTRESICPSAKIAHNIKGLLGQKNLMPPEDLMVIKEVIKTDARYRQLSKYDSTLFKDILKTQLQEILKQETVVKSVLDKLGELTDPKCCPMPLLEDIYSYTDSTSPRKPQVDVIFKNVPTLEKEIIILKALGEKLEATLRRTASQQNITQFVGNPNIDCKSGQLRHEWLIAREHNAAVEVRPLGIVHNLDLIKEFEIENKTIVELREQANRHFYLPTDQGKSDLRRTSFKRLKDTPEVLKRLLKPKSALVPFNVVDHDPIFFNSFLYNLGNDRNDGSKLDDIFSEGSATQSSQSGFSLREGGDAIAGKRMSYQCLPNKEPLHIEEIGEPCCLGKLEPKASRAQAKIPEFSKLVKQRIVIRADEREASPEPVVVLAGTSKAVPFPMADADKSPKISLNKKSPCEGMAVVQGPLILSDDKRRRIRRVVTPMPLDKFLQPKNNLFKTILVGAVQIAVFLILIMAVTYPDISC